MKSNTLKFAALFFSLTAVTLFFCYQMGYFAQEGAVNQHTDSPLSPEAEADVKSEADMPPAGKPVRRKEFNKNGHLPADFSMDPETRERESRLFIPSSKSIIFRDPLPAVIETQPAATIEPVPHNPAAITDSQSSEEPVYRRMSGSKSIILHEPKQTETVDQREQQQVKKQWFKKKKL